MAPRYASSWMSYIGRVHDLLAWPEVKLATFARAGVLVRVHRRGHAPCMLFTQQSVGDRSRLRDFGGRVDSAEHPVHTALRELQEESLGVLLPWVSTPQSVLDSKVFALSDNLYVLVDLYGVNVADVQAQFLKTKAALTAKALASGCEVPEYLREVDEIVDVPMWDILSKLHLRTPPVYGKYQFSWNMWKVLRGMGQRV